ncbi:TlpA disulfide reductase family protein [Sulfurovum sp. zt1-1]|uniref:TlpA disulfide reductase family protein n=1 Tax=Sulfurovum zhangzhouensis TaxID=3019067 RepID=A0ABT7R0U5_9BACT|nr:TlpA disulfide reductase family protein [Sulfurovum zhangzhouensis]MDM5272714.1 TlpA disulfide reductase family protein [Sulfurovum zhangzhouensis]
MKKILTLFFIIVSLGAYLYAEEQPDLSFKDINGTTIQIKGSELGLDIPSLKGKVVFLEFFGHRCPPCLKSIPHLIDLQTKYKDKLAIVSVEVQGMNEEALKDFVFEKGINYTVTTEQNARILVNYIAARAEWSGSIPFMVAMDTKGDVQFVQVGMIPQDYLENLIAQLSK